MKVVKKKLRLRFNKDKTKLSDKKISGRGERWWDTEKKVLYVDTRRVGTKPTIIENKTIISNFAKLVDLIIQEIQEVIDVNEKWLSIKKPWKIPISDGYIIKNPLEGKQREIIEERLKKQKEMQLDYIQALKEIKKTIK